MEKLKTESIKIPLSLLKKIICLLEYWDPDMDEYDPAIVKNHGEIVLALNNMKKSIELRNAFTRIINDSEYDPRWESHMNYLQRKHESDLPF